MKILSFTWNGKTPLIDELSKPLTHLSIEWADHAKASQVSLWQQNGSGIRIYSEMHDLAERIEIGVLVFSPVSSALEGEQFIELDHSFREAVHPSKLVIHESGTAGDSGIVLQASNGSEVIIVAAAFPYFLFLGGLPAFAQSVVPEYSLDHYTRVRLA